jgi:hypothetical protein
LPKPNGQEVGGSDPTFFKGSFFIYLLFVPAFLLIILAILLAMQYKQLKTFVSPKAITLSSIPASPQSEEKVVQKLKVFFSENLDDSTGDSLVLSPLEINYLIRSSKSLTALKLDYHMDIQDTLLVAHNSLPVDHLNGFLSFLAKILRVKGFLNSEMRGYLTFEKGEVRLIPISATMNGVPAPVSVLNRKGGIDPKEWVEDTVFFNQVISRLHEIKIRNNFLILSKKSSK